MFFLFVCLFYILKLLMEQHENMISSLEPTLLPLRVSKKRDYPMGTQILSDFPWWASFQRGQRSGLCALTWPSGSPCLNTTVTWRYTTAMWHICRCIALSKYVSYPNIFVWEKSLSERVEFARTPWGSVRWAAEGKHLPHWHFSSSFHSTYAASHQTALCSKERHSYIW